MVIHGSDARASDDNPGTSEKPFKTIGRAAEAVETGDVVRIGSGVYRERVVVEKSGIAEKPITFEAAVGGRSLASRNQSVVPLGLQ